ncbi:copper chaperone [Peribacillus cavernae]|uniref:Copper chaperone n=1 Tax=Peribacillus cavernae TaxID=1674310 RepID=A0A3S0VML6_9BACI|nr:heavy-metal-associated domain-containing protein [Peribacillus cavernae]MDQ0220627.1 copper chaperone CopZ [Peribacillus cavernae]RUQ31089.1 copper chaperone [Peribacillus cavernae]
MNRNEEAVVVVKSMQNQVDADKVLNVLLGVWGIEGAEVNLYSNKATFTYDNRMASLHDFEQALLDAGYDVTTVSSER